MAGVVGGMPALGGPTFADVSDKLCILLHYPTDVVGCSCGRFSKNQVVMFDIYCMCGEMQMSCITAVLNHQPFLNAPL